eukprot:350255-Chlamydomonas_euryale.AAC.41
MPVWPTLAERARPLPSRAPLIACVDGALIGAGGARGRGSGGRPVAALRAASRRSVAGAAALPPAFCRAEMPGAAAEQNVVPTCEPQAPAPLLPSSSLSRMEITPSAWTLMRAWGDEGRGAPLPLP